MAVKHIKSLAHFIGNCSEIKTKPDHTLFFRGHADKDYKALPTIFRYQDNDPKNEKFINREEELYHNLITRCPEDFSNCISTFDYLVKMQHYGLPTRLLDITSNPLVALYFACCSLSPKKPQDRSAKDAQILIYQVPNSEIKYYSSDTVSVISNLAKVKSNFNFSNKDQRRRFVHNIESEKPYFLDDIKLTDLQQAVCVKPKLDNRRIIKQSGAFFLFGMGEQKTDSKLIRDEYRPEIKHINIPKASKLNLLKELETLSISKATLFPEIDHVAQFLQTEKRVKPFNSEIFEEVMDEEVVSGAEISVYASSIIELLPENVLEQVKNNTKEQLMQGDFYQSVESAIIDSMEEHQEMADKALADNELAQTCIFRSDRSVNSV